MFEPIVWLDEISDFKLSLLLLSRNDFNYKKYIVKIYIISSARIFATDQSKFTGYLGRILVNIFMKKSFFSFFLVRKKYSLPFFLSRNLLAPKI